MTLFDIFLDLFRAHGLTVGLLAEFDILISSRLPKEGTGWWNTPLEPSELARLQPLLTTLSQPGPNAEREVFLRRILLRVTGNATEADDAWDRLTILLASPERTDIRQHRALGGSTPSIKPPSLRRRRKP